ncbi:tetratricopeptide repeat protein [Candidatus Entotheonella palauensis]|nr:tetratricopeptide repeat protein [Candidatus Entotheonella palauensis]
MRASRCFVQGQRLAANGQLDEALNAFEQALAWRPQMTGVHLHYALALSDADRLDEAVSAMHKAMAIEPLNAVLPMFLGLILFDHADYPGAQSWCEQALILDPQQLRAQALLALVDLAEGRVARGYEQLQQSQSPSLSMLERLAFKCGMRQPPLLYQQASSMWQSRLLLVIESHLMRAGDGVPTLADRLIHDSPQAEALQHVNIVDRILTPCVMTLIRLSYRLRYAAQPTRRDMWLRYAEAEEAYFTAQPDTAVDIYEQLMPDFPEPQRLEQRLYEIAYARGDFQRARTHWCNWSHLAEPDLGPLDRLQQAELQYQAGDYEGTKATLEQLTILPWSDFRVPYYEGLCHLRAGAKREAHRCFIETARRLNPNIVGVRLEELHRLHRAQPGPSVVDSMAHRSTLT